MDRRPTFILAEPEPQEAISTRKLVLETAKFNVITAYSSQEVVATLERFPDSDAVILHEGLTGAASAAVAVRKRAPRMTMIILASGHGTGIKSADHSVSSYDPQALLNLLRDQFGDPRPEANRRSGQRTA